MTNEEGLFLLNDRIDKIKQINEQYDLGHNSYLSFSGGKDSMVLHYLVDMALPGNQIPRLYLNTGLEYIDMLEYVKHIQQNDDRIIIHNSNVNIKKMLETVGYPFKSKEHSKKHEMFKKGYNSEWVKNYIDFERKSRFKCPKILQYQFTDDFPLKLSDKCCYELKKKPAHKWAKENNKSIVILGLRMAEGGQRKNAKNCLVFSKDKLKGFKPLNPISDDWMNWFIEKYNIELCRLYLPPFNFEGTGCKGCPFALNLQNELDKLERYLPTEKRQCEIIWEVPYLEMRRLGYRLRKNGSYKQTTIFDYLEE